MTSNPPLLSSLGRRWWLILVITCVAIGTSFVYSGHQRTRYEASTAIYVYPEGNVHQRLHRLNLLAYGTVLHRLSNVAESPSTLHRVAASLRIGSDGYVVTAMVEPQTTAIYIWVDGPSRGLTQRIANMVPARVGAASTSTFHDSVSRLDGVASLRQVQPATERNAVVGGLFGLLVGCALVLLIAAASVDNTASPARHRRNRSRP
jgi:capsular polysaccharide biosynthesis protein